MEEIEVFAKNLQKYRKKKGLTQTQLAEKLHEATGKQLAVSSISSYETGMNVPSLQMLPSIARILGVSIDVLFGNETESLPEVGSEEEEHPLLPKITKLEEELILLNSQQPTVLSQKVGVIMTAYKELVEIAKKQQNEIMILKTKFNMVRQMLNELKNLG